MINDDFSLFYKYKDQDINICNASIESVEINNTDNSTNYALNENVDVLDDENCKDDFDYNINNISDIDELAIIIKMLLELSWGKDWGEIVPEFIEDDTNPIFPKIVYDVNTREISEHSAKKPTLYGRVKEVIDGVETGDGFNIYRQWFDTVIEFNFFHHNIKDARKLMHEFEKVIDTYIGMIKKKGLSEMQYLEEIPSEKSLKYKPGTPMKSNAYYVRFESIYKVRTSLLKEINILLSKEK